MASRTLEVESHVKPPAAAPTFCRPGMLKRDLRIRMLSGEIGMPIYLAASQNQMRRRLPSTPQSQRSIGRRMQRGFRVCSTSGIKYREAWMVTTAFPSGPELLQPGRPSYCLSHRQVVQFICLGSHVRFPLRPSCFAAVDQIQLFSSFVWALMSGSPFGPAILQQWIKYSWQHYSSWPVYYNLFSDNVFFCSAV